MFSMNKYVLKFDGCSKGNPGLAGAGAVIYNHNKIVWEGSLFVGEMMTNNYAEYIALIFGLEQAIHLGIKEIKVEGDSLLVINQMNEYYTCKSLTLLELYEKAKELSKKFEKIEYNHILRNSNKYADKLCNLAIQKYNFEIKKDDDYLIF